MKIAMMVRGYIPVPRLVDIVYTPIDLAVGIAQGLEKRGHEVDFFAPNGSQIPGVNVETCNLRPLARNKQEYYQLNVDLARQNHYVPALWNRYLSDEMFRRANDGKYDLLHFHHPEDAIASAKANPNVPVAYTLHDPIFPWYKELFELYNSPNQHFISVSNNQRRDAPDLNYMATVYNATDPEQFFLNEKPDDYLLYEGRIVPEKGIKECVQIALETKHRLLIIGPIYPDSQDYFDQYIKPHLSDRILYLGFIELQQMPRYYQNAKAFLMPIQWEEPFGVTMIEAMSCGTPVIALRRGSVPEIVEHGKTGFICDSVGEMIEAVGKVKTISRRACHEHVKQKFSIDTMVDSYEKAFEEILRKRKPTLTKTFVRSQLRRVPGAIKGGLTKTKNSKPVRTNSTRPTTT